MKKIPFLIAILLGTQGINAELQEPYFLCQFDDAIAANNNNDMTSKPKVNASTVTMAKENYLNEEALLKQLNPQMQKIYESLTPEGKALVLELANQPNGSNDKNQAVRAAVDRLTDKRRRLAN